MLNFSESRLSILVNQQLSDLNIILYSQQIKKWKGEKALPFNLKSNFSPKKGTVTHCLPRIWSFLPTPLGKKLLNFTPCRREVDAERFAIATTYIPLPKSCRNNMACMAVKYNTTQCSRLPCFCSRHWWHMLCHLRQMN